MQYSNNQVEPQFISQGRFMLLECDILGKGATGIVYKGIFISKKRSRQSGKSISRNKSHPNIQDESNRKKLDIK